MSENELAILICGCAAVLSLLLLIWAQSLRDHFRKLERDADSALRTVDRFSDDIRVHRNAIEAAAKLIDRAANPPKPEKKVARS